MEQMTFPQLLAARARQKPTQVALREKDYGIWNEYTYRDYYEQVKALALGLASLGFRRGDKLAIIGDNRPEWVFSQLAAQSLGGVSVGIYQESLPNELAYIIDNCDATFVVVEDQEQVDKVLEVEQELSKVKHIIYYDSRGMRNYKHDKLLYFKMYKRSVANLNKCTRHILMMKCKKDVMMISPFYRIRLERRAIRKGRNFLIATYSKWQKPRKNRST